MDARLRQLERRWIETQSLEAEAAWLRERVRQGDLTEYRLKMAAELGHDGAEAALGAGEQSSLAVRIRLRLRHRGRTAPHNLGRWIMWLEERWGFGTACKALSILERRFQPEGATSPRAGVPHSLELLDALEAWCDCECSEHSEQAEALLGSSLVQALEASYQFPRPWMAAAHLATAASLRHPGREISSSYPLLQVGLRLVLSAAPSPKGLRDLLRRELRRWALR